MNFLQLCQQTRQELGSSGTGPDSVKNQSGHYKKIVDWVSLAHQEVQEAFSLANSNWGITTQSTTAGTRTYDPNDVWGLQFDRLVPNSVYAVVGTTTYPINVITWDEMRERIRIPMSGNVPNEVAMAPDHVLYFDPIPGINGSVKFEYEKLPQVLVENTDEPRLPTQYHWAIVWRAVMLGCAHDENQQLFVSARRNYASLVNRYSNRELPEMLQCGPLA